MLGISFGLLFYSFWLVDHFPAISKQALFYSVLATLVGIAGYYLLLKRCIGPTLPQITKSSRWGLVVGSVLIGAYLAQSYLNIPGSPPRYVAFLLPRQSLKISVPSQVGSSAAQVAILRFSTSMGDVSYNSLEYRGWTRDGSDLVLTEPSKNVLDWTGRAGQQAVLAFRTFPEVQKISISWNGVSQNVEIPAGADGRYEVAQAFTIPIYASHRLLLLLCALNFITLCIAANAVIWNHRTAILAGLERSSSDLLQRTTGIHARLADREWWIVASLVVLALLLRVFNLGNLYPYADEYSHLLAAKALLEGAPWNSVFDRSLLIVTLPVVISQRLFGIDLWSARLPGTLVNALAIIPLYVLTRKINKPVAVLAALLYASSPFIIAVSRNIREYAYYPFFFYWIVLAMVLFIERLPGNLIIFRDWKKLCVPDMRWLTLALALPPIYAVFLDARSSFKIILIAYAVLALFLLKRFDLRNKANLAILVTLGLALIIGGFLYAQSFGFHNLSVIPRFHTEALGLFFPNPLQQWYSDRPAIVPALALLVAAVICFKTARANLVPAFLATTLLASTVFFTTFFGHYFMPRYLTSMELWYVVVMAFGLYGLFALQLALPRKDIVLPLLTTALFAVTFNITPTLLPTFYDKQGNMPITGEYHYNLGPASTFLLDKVSDKDVLISNYYAGYVRWKGAPAFRQIYSYGFYTAKLQYKWIFPYEAAETLPVDPRQYILSIVQANPSGWIVLDSVTYASTLAKPLPLKTTLVNGKQIGYRGYFGGEYIWGWGGVQPAP